MIRTTSRLAVFVLLTLAACSTEVTTKDTIQDETATPYEVETVAEGFEHPWGMAFLPTGELLVTKRPGRLNLVEPKSGTVEEITGVPEVDTRGQGGLLDVTLYPDFETEPWVYLTWAGNRDGLTATYIGRGLLDLEALTLTDLELLHIAGPHVDSTAHYGSRIVFDHENRFYVTVGDRNNKDFGPDHVSQDRSNYLGTTLRFEADGSIPEDNPFVDDPDVLDAIYSYGHRNPQGLAVHPETGELWQNEHGERKGDEINVIEAGGNYGWPIATYAADYNTGEAIGVLPPERPDTVPPVYFWDQNRPQGFPPSGFVFYDGDAFPAWQGDAFMGNLSGRFIGRFSVAEREVSENGRLLEGQGWRVRDLAVGPDDGFLYVLIDDANAPLVRLRPDRGDAPNASQPFTVRGGKIYDPAGEEFIIKGANVQGRNFGWEDTDTLTYADNIIDDWRFNLVRVNEYVKGTPFCTRENPASWCKPYWGRGATPEEHDPLVDTFTSRGVVVLFEAHDWSGSYPNDEDLAELIAWHTGLAERYKDNPYVWFNIVNEPGNNCQPVSPRWLEIHDAVIGAIRATGNQNIVVANGSNFGIERDCGTNPDGSTSYKPKGPVPDNYSAVLTYGPELADTYDNVVFSLHTYCIWTPTGDASFNYEADSEAAMNDYFDRVAANDLTIFVGEYGNSGGGNCNALPATRTTYKVTVPRGIGRVVWHWWAGDDNQLVYGDQGFRINSPTDPTNLTQLGKLVWDDTHDNDGTGSVYVDPNKQVPEGALERSGWTASATPGLPTTNQFTNENIEAANMLDGNFGTYWATGKLPETGTYIRVDLGAERTFSGVAYTLDGNGGNFPDGLDVQVSDDGDTWTTVAEGVPGERAQPFRASFAEQTARYVKLVWSAPQGQRKWWAISEFFLTE